MTSDSGRSPEIAHGLAAVVRMALGADAPALQRMAARDVAQVLGLDALDAALAELDRHTGAARPREAMHLAERIARMIDAVERDGDLAIFAQAAPELDAMTEHLRATEWGAPAAGDAGGPALASLSAHEVLGDLPLEHAEDLSRARLSANVAASLRAALDWTGFDLAPSVQAQVQDSALTLSALAGHEAGIGPAAAVLAAIEGSMSREADGRWTMRVPLHVERLSYLLMRQGSLSFALPWHAVSRLRMFSAAEIARLAEPVLPPFVKSIAPEGERPAALVAHGLARAWVIADRIVWRIAAVAEASGETGPFASQARIVRVESGEKYWVLDPIVLLRDVALPEVASPVARPRHGAAPAPATLQPLALASAMDEPVVDEHVVDEQLVDEQAEEALEQLRAEELSAAVARAIDSLRAEVHASEPVVAPVHAEPAPVAAPEPVPVAAAVAFTPHVTVIAASDVWPELAAPVQGEIERYESGMAEAETEAETEADAEAEARSDVAGSMDLGVADAATPLPMAFGEPEFEIEPELEPEPEPEPEVAAVEPERVFAAPASAPALRPSELAARTPARRALIADDSMVARIFLGRMLERRGFIVETVGDAAAMWSELERGPWNLVCADYAMPESYGRSHLQRLLDFRAGCREPFAFVVLTRDDEEEAIAREAGAVLHLRKPFENEALDRVIQTTPEPR